MNTRLTRALLAILVLVSCAASLRAATYTQPFTAGHGFTPAQSGACDNTYTDNAADSTNGNPVNSVNSLCNGRNDLPTTTWSKELTWAAMDAALTGMIIDTVDGKLDHQRTTQTHAQVATVGALDIRVSGGATSCMASQLEGTHSYANDTGTISWATLDATGAVAVSDAGCQAAATTVRVQFIINPRTGNNGSAETQVNVDNLILTIVAHSPATGQIIVISKLIPINGRVQ